MKLTKTRLKKIIHEELKRVLREAELAPAIYNALKAKGKLPAGATMKQAAEPKAAAAAEPKAGLDFDTGTGEPLTKKGERQCAAKEDCFKKWIMRHTGNGKLKFSVATGQKTRILLGIAKASGHSPAGPKVAAAGKPSQPAQQKAAAQVSPKAQKQQKLASLAALDKDIESLSDEEVLARLKARKQK
jgi:hypothetical protein